MTGTEFVMFPCKTHICEPPLINTLSSNNPARPDLNQNLNLTSKCLSICISPHTYLSGPCSSLTTLSYFPCLLLLASFLSFVPYLCQHRLLSSFAVASCILPSSLYTKLSESLFMAIDLFSFLRQTASPAMVLVAPSNFLSTLYPSKSIIKQYCHGST